MYALPFMDFTAGLLYNKKLFAAAGLNPNDPPTTLEQLTADAKKLTKTGAGGKITQLGFTPDWPGPDEGQVCPLETYGWLFGGQWYDSSTGKITPDTLGERGRAVLGSQLREAVRRPEHRQLPEQRGRVPDSAGPVRVRQAGDGLRRAVGAAVHRRERAERGQLDRCRAAPGAGRSPQNTGTSFIDTNPQLVPRGAQYPQQAFDFISWLTTNAQLASTFANLVANLPQLKSVPSFSLEKNAGFDFFIKNGASSHVHVWPPLATSSEYATKLCQAQNAALFGQQTPAQALSSLTNLSQ